MNTIEAFLEAHRERLELERYGLTGPLSCVLVTPRFRASSHVVCLVLPRGCTRPALVAKVPRLEQADAHVAREAANLQAVQALRPGGFDSIPRVVALERFQGHSIFVQTALVGKTLDRPTTRRDPDRWCRAILDWLGEIRLRVPAAPGAERLERLVEKPLHRLAESCPLQPEERGWLDETLERVAALRDVPLAGVFEHGDLSPPNILRLADGGVGVLDWELAEPDGLPAIDLFFFLSYAAFARVRARSTADYVRGFDQAFFGRRAWARPYVLAYARQNQIPTDALTPLFLACWVLYMARLVGRLAAPAPGGAALPDSTSAWLRTNRYYHLWRHAHAHLDELDWCDLPSSGPCVSELAHPVRA
jgi:aminoglycoside phosphotransferase (APT) family kinase protein